jgi:hypothetical protein
MSGYRKKLTILLSNIKMLKREPPCPQKREKERELATSFETIFLIHTKLPKNRIQDLDMYKRESLDFCIYNNSFQHGELSISTFC